MAQLKQLVEYIAQSIVTHPNDVVVTEEENEQGRVFITLQVHPEDKGKVIGRQGRVAQSIRSLLRVAAVKNGVHANLDIDRFRLRRSWISVKLLAVQERAQQ